MESKSRPGDDETGHPGPDEHLSARNHFRHWPKGRLVPPGQPSWASSILFGIIWSVLFVLASLALTAPVPTRKLLLDGAEVATVSALLLRYLGVTMGPPFSWKHLFALGLLVGLFKLAMRWVLPANAVGQTFLGPVAG